MRQFRFVWLAAVLCPLFLPALAVAQCSGGSCASSYRGPVGPSYLVTPSYTPTYTPAQTPTATAPSWEWKKIPDEPDHLYLFKDGVQVGALHMTEGYYRPFDSNRWGPKGSMDMARIQRREPELEVIPVGASDAYPPSGVDGSKISNKDKYQCRDRDGITKFQALDLVGKIPDYSGKKFFTVIGTESECKAVIDALNTSEFKDKYIVNDFRPSDWQLRPGYIGSEQKFSILLQDKADPRGYGKVLMHLDAVPSPQVLVEGLRKSDPDYDRNKNPNPLKPKPPEIQPTKPDEVVSSPLSGVRGYLLPGGLLAALALLFFKRSI